MGTRIRVDIEARPNLFGDYTRFVVGWLTVHQESVTMLLSAARSRSLVYSIGDDLLVRNTARLRIVVRPMKVSFPNRRLRIRYVRVDKENRILGCRCTRS